MKSNTVKRLLPVLTAVALGCASAAAMAADDAAAAAPDDAAQRASWRELSAQWWQWALSIPVSVNPLRDPVDASTTEAVNCMVGQHGPVWFLAGALASGTVRRSCSVPAGVTLFFPVINSAQGYTPGCPPAGSRSVTKLREAAAALIDAATGIEAKLDNRPIRNIRRVRSEVFVIALPNDNIAGCPQSAVYSPAVDDGYYVRLDGLAPGMHTLTFRGKSGSFELDVAYELNVVPVSRAVGF